MKTLKPNGFAFLPILLIVLVVGIVGAGVYSRMNNGARVTDPVVTDTETTTDTATDTTVAQALRSETTFLELIDKGNNLECDWTSPETSAPLNGKLYTTQGKARSSATSSQDIAGMSIAADVVFMDETAYGWITLNNEVSPQGFKITKDEMTAMNDDLTAEQKQQADVYRQKMDFDCKPWSVDQSMFTLPTAVTFE